MLIFVFREKTNVQTCGFSPYHIHKCFFRYASVTVCVCTGHHIFGMEVLGGGGLGGLSDFFETVSFFAVPGNHSLGIIPWESFPGNHSLGIHPWASFPGNHSLGFIP